jgi:hypothetical protein
MDVDPKGPIREGVTMPQYDDRPTGLDDRPRIDDAGAGPGVRPGAPGRSAPDGSRQGRTWVWLTAGVVGLVAGIVIGHGLLIAAGLVVAGFAGQLLDPQRRRPGSAASRSR